MQHGPISRITSLDAATKLNVGVYALQMGISTKCRIADQQASPKGPGKTTHRLTKLQGVGIFATPVGLMSITEQGLKICCMLSVEWSAEPHAAVGLEKAAGHRDSIVTLHASWSPQAASGLSRRRGIPIDPERPLAGIPC